MKSGGGLQALLQKGGGKALYAGLWGNLAGVAPASALFMAVYEPVRPCLLPLPPSFYPLLFLFPPFRYHASQYAGKFKQVCLCGRLHASELHPRRSRAWASAYMRANTP